MEVYGQIHKLDNDGLNYVCLSCIYRNVFLSNNTDRILKVKVTRLILHCMRKQPVNPKINSPLVKDLSVPRSFDTPSSQHCDVHKYNTRTD